MSQNDSARYLVTYDIADPKRLGRLFRFLKKQGIPVQYSVFLVHASATKIASLMLQIAKMIDADADDVRAYRMPENGWQITLGASILPDDVLPGGPSMLAQRSDEQFQALDLSARAPGVKPPRNSLIEYIFPDNAK
jgi:CRISPR-associated protein Cas2